MKKILLYPIIGILSLVFGCSKESLDLTNPNEPGLDALATEEGAVRVAIGVYEKFGLEYWWLALKNHEIMGDSYVSNVGNYAWRWVNQPASMILSDNTIITPPAGGRQPDELRNRNSRAFGNDNQFYNEWLACYLVNNQANLLLEVANSPTNSFNGNANVKVGVLKAWAYWWKGFIYSRLGSLYTAGLINSTYNTVNSDYVTNAKLIEEANKNFDEAITVLQTLTEGNDYNEFLGKLIPSFTKVGKGGVLSPDEWIRNINTYKARNLLVNKYASDLSASDLSQILTLVNNGIKKDDKIFTNRSALINDFVSESAWTPYRVLVGWIHISERLIQEYYTGDKRFERNYKIPSRGYYQLNPSGRGYQYSTRFEMVPIESGGDYASTVAGSAEMPVGCSYEENELMLAEVKIRSNNVNEGLKHIDNVRDYQKAGLLKLENSGLTQTNALEVLRRERRVALLNKNVSFYDARRQGFLKPVSAGGGRRNANLFYQRTGQNAALETGVTMNYDYLEWWDVPMNELEFNSPSASSADLVGN
jgi:starch-binding outer membrane protein, SusD/RagB family